MMAKVLGIFAAAVVLSGIAAAGEHVITIDGKSPGRVFEGVGALSAGASSRLLYDYPEPQRSQILDFLFKPNFGAGLHHLKVEIGGDVNSTDGSEPSHAATREEFQSPAAAFFQRGYEWWLMKEARRRNPEIALEALQWGAPGWVGNGNLFSEDNAELVASFLRGAKRHHGLDIGFVGIWNEHPYDPAYLKLLRRVLDRHGLANVKIDAGDLWKVEEKWMIADALAKDPELKAAVGVINAHTTATLNFYTPDAAQKLGIPIWDGELHGHGGDWYAAANHARHNRAYPVGKITGLISWSLITSYHDFLAVPNSGMMKANTPWSGHYDVQPPLWIIAHFNQFARPGWKYLDSACRYFSDEMTREGFSVTALKAPAGNDYSVLIETMDAREDQTITFKVSNDLSPNDLAVWRSTFNRDLFLRLDDIEIRDGQFSIKVEPGSIYSLTTARGQQKGRPATKVPASGKFPFPYNDDFEQEQIGKPGRYFSDQHGTFEVAPRPEGAGKCLKQTVLQQGICWGSVYPHPQTIIGDMDWRDYLLSVNVMLPDGGSAKVWGRGRPGPSEAHLLEVNGDGNWSLKAGVRVLASGRAAPMEKAWHKVALSFRGDTIQAFLDDRKLAEAKDTSIRGGLVGLGSGWNSALFDNLQIREAK